VGGIWWELVPIESASTPASYVVKLTANDGGAEPNWTGSIQLWNADGTPTSGPQITPSGFPLNAIGLSGPYIPEVGDTGIAIPDSVTPGKFLWFSRPVIGITGYGCAANLNVSSSTDQLITFNGVAGNFTAVPFPVPGTYIVNISLNILAVLASNPPGIIAARVNFDGDLSGGLSVALCAQATNTGGYSVANQFSYSFEVNTKTEGVTTIGVSLILDYVFFEGNPAATWTSVMVTNPSGSTTSGLQLVQIA